MTLYSTQLLSYIGDKKPQKVISKYCLQKANKEHLYILENRHVVDGDAILMNEENLFICTNTQDLVSAFIKTCVDRIQNNYIYYPCNKRELLSMEFRRDN